MDRQDEVYSYNGILFSLKKGGNFDTNYNINAPWRHCHCKSVTTKTHTKTLHDSTYMMYLEQSKSWRHKVEWWSPIEWGGEGGGMGS